MLLLLIGGRAAGNVGAGVRIMAAAYRASATAQVKSAAVTIRSAK